MLCPLVYFKCYAFAKSLRVPLLAASPCATTSLTRPYCSSLLLVLSTSVPLYMLAFLPVKLFHVLILTILAFRACLTATFFRKPSLNSPGHNGFHISQHMPSTFLQCTTHDELTTNPHNQQLVSSFPNIWTDADAEIPIL